MNKIWTKNVFEKCNCIGAVLRRFRKDPDLKNFDYHTVYPSIVCAVESILKYMSPPLSQSPTFVADKLHFATKKNKDKNESATTNLTLTNKAFQEDTEEVRNSVSIQINEDNLNFKF